MADPQQVGMVAVAAVAEASLGASALEQHSALAHVSHIAALAAERLQTEQGDAVADVLAMLREVQNHGHLAYLRHRGTEADY